MRTGGAKKWVVRIVIGLLAAVLVAMVGMLLFQKLYYENRWYKNTRVNGVDVSGQTLEESKSQIENMHQNYSLQIKARNDGSLLINGSDIDYTFAVGTEFVQQFQQQHDKFSLFSRKNDYALEYDVFYNQEKLTNIVSESAIMVGSPEYEIHKPVSAHVEYSSETGQYVCVPEDYGNKLNKKMFLQTLDEVLLQALSEIDITDTEKYPDVYRKPKITSEDERIQTALSTCNNAALRYVTWNMGQGVKEQITPEDISQWITYKGGKIHYDNQAIADWIEAFCLRYKTVGATRTITSHTGKKVKIVGGDYGWRIDYEKTVKQAKKALKQKIDPALTQAFIDEPNDANKKAINIKKKVIYSDTAFQKNYNNLTEDWDTKNYTEISISDQMVYVFRDGKVKFSCRCITGRPEEGRTTPTGAYYVKEHKEAYTLTGADYSTPVRNWVRITWTGTGFHPATWQSWSTWTKDTYKTRGSHGCINLSVEDAQKIYDMVQYREAVFIY